MLTSDTSPFAEASHVKLRVASGTSTLPTHGTPATAQDGRAVLAKFRVEAPFRGREMLRPITYFPIHSEVLSVNDTTYTIPDIPINAFHLRHVPSGVQRNSWTRGSCAMVERRYSEVVDLRALLAYQFPTLIVPPLPEKDSVHDVETYLNAGDAVTTQRHNLQFFLKEIAAMPEIVFFSEWVPPFFLEPRDSFEASSLLSMRAALRTYRSASKIIRQFSQRHRSVAEDTANLIAQKSTSLVRSVAGLFSWGSHTPDGPRPITMEAPVVSVPTDWSACTQLLQNEDVARWITRMEQLQERQLAVKDMARTFEAYLAAFNAKNGEQMKVAEAISGYERVLKESGGFTQLGDSYHCAQETLESVTRQEEASASGKYLNICLRLAFEANYIDSVLDAVDHVISLFLCIHSNAWEATPQVSSDIMAYAEAVSKGLGMDYEKRYQRYYRHRMLNLIQAKLVAPNMQLAEGMDASWKHSSLARLIAAKGFVSYGVEEGAE